MDRSFVVLLVEDNPAHRRLTAEMLSETGISVQLFEVENGEDALHFLRGEFAGCPRPDLVLLDLSLPDMNGREVLSAMHADPALATIPVVVQTSDDDDRTVVETRDLGAHEHVTKPLTRERFLGVVEYVGQFA
jgi:CheY-like chemotaxis protein